MNLKNLFSNGWFQVSFMVIVLWGLMNITFRVCASVLDVNYIIFTCSLFLSSSFTLLLFGGSGRFAKETMRSVDTWFYGVVLLILYVLNLYLFNIVTSTEGTILQRLSIIVSLLMGGFFLGRKFNAIQLSGATVVFIGIVLICIGIPDQKTGVLYTIVVLSAVLQAAQIFAAEFHRPHKKAAEISPDPRSKLRVVGFVMFVTSTLFFMLTFLLALTQGLHATENQIMADLPVLRDFLHTPSILSGMLVGILIVAPIKALEFSGAQKINANNFLAICCLTPAATLFWEWGTSPLTGLSLRQFSQTDLFAGIAVTIGGFIVAFGALQKKDNGTLLDGYLMYSAQDLDQVEDSREILAGTLAHFSGDIKKAAKVLELPISVLEAMLMDSDKVLAFKVETFKEVARRYRRNVAMSDALTGLANRAGFMTALKGAMYETDVFSVLFIDLDKFKPVNDLYGHDAGDAVLKGIANRLAEMFPKRALATRLGGDEFCILLLDLNKQEAQKLIPEIQTTIAQPFKVGGHSVAVSASIGVASYPEDAENAEALLKMADAGMYSDKKEQ